MDSPTCKKCQDEGRGGQTYKCWGGKVGFRCNDCKIIYKGNDANLVYE